MKVPILLPNIFNHPFTYESSNLDLRIGDYVIVPFGKSKLTGIVWNEFEKNKNKQYLIKTVIRKLEIPSLNPETINFLKWFSEYNMVPIGLSLKLHLLSNEAIEIQNNEVVEYDSQKNVSIVDLTVAGDLFASCLLHGHINSLTIKKSLQKATEVSSKIIQNIDARLN